MPLHSTSTISSSRNSDTLSLSLTSGYDVDSMSNSLYRMNLDTTTDDQSLRIFMPFLFPTNDDKANAARSNQLASAILTIGDNVEQAATVKRLLNEKSRKFLNQRDPRGRTPLMYAIASGNAAIVKLLISCPSIDPTTRDRFGNTTIMYSAGHGYRQITKDILDEIKTRSCEEHWPTDMLTFLYAENYDQETAFTLALNCGHEDCIQVLSDYFREALYEDERRKGSFIYRLGIRGAAVARALTYLQNKGGARRRKTCHRHGDKEPEDQNNVDQNHDHNSRKVESAKMKRRQRALSQSPNTRKKPSPPIFSAILLSTPSDPALNLAINYRREYD